MKIFKALQFILSALFIINPLCLLSQERDSIPIPLTIGFSIGILQMNHESMEYAKSVGISYLQISLNQFCDKDGNFKFKDGEIIEIVKKVKKVVDEAGLKVSSFHMPYGEHIDLSLINETERQRVVALHKKVLQLCSILKPTVVLFHPSWYLSLNEREEHIKQLVKSVNDLSNPVKRIGAIMVIENMTGPQLNVERKSVKYERPLCRTVDETMEIMNMLPANIYAAVDMNHILHPEKLILAFGHRMKFIHVSDGDGEHEYHYFPCSGKGMNDWNAILSALQKIGYKGPFMFECHYKDVKDLKECYDTLFADFIKHDYDESSK